MILFYYDTVIINDTVLLMILFIDYCFIDDTVLMPTEFYLITVLFMILFY